jgi:glycosyltransferase involved in cell wall biosynthesis
MNEKPPLITFTLFAYNQEEYIRAAVEGAFAQRYENLEIILSDDRSSDNTWKIMHEMAEAYSGNHRVVLNRNETNRGLVGHINQVMSMVRSDWVVVAAGDDISYPSRVQLTYDAIQKYPNARSLYFNTDYIRDDPSNPTVFVPDVSTHAIIPMIRNCGAKVFGPSHAWSMETFRVFGDISEDAVSEDRVIPFRSALLGEIEFIDIKAVQYRLHNSSISTTGMRSNDSKGYRRYRMRQASLIGPTLASMLRDLEKAFKLSILSKSTFDQYSKLLKQQQRLWEMYMSAWFGLFPIRQWAAFKMIFVGHCFTLSKGKLRQRLFVFIDSVFPFCEVIYHKTFRLRR